MAAKWYNSLDTNFNVPPFKGIQKLINILLRLFQSRFAQKKRMGKKAKYLVLQFKCRISSVWRHTCHDKRQQVFGPQNAMWSKSQFYIQLLYKQKFENMNSTVWAIGKLVSILLFGWFYDKITQNFYHVYMGKKNWFKKQFTVRTKKLLNIWYIRDIGTTKIFVVYSLTKFLFWIFVITV